MRPHFVIESVALQSRRRSNGGSSMCFSLIEITTSLDEFGMSGCSSQ